MYKIDLHTHSVASPDGGLSADHYEKIIRSSIVDCVAITDHNRIDFAVAMQQRLGDRVIVGEEIMTTEGEIIGLFLSKEVPGGLTPEQAIERIKEQDGLVYIPHPFESVRHGLHPRAMEALAGQIDIVEVCNGRAFLQNKSQQTVVWTRLNNKIGVASSDAHGPKGVGKTFTVIRELPTHKTLLNLLSSGTTVTDRPGVRALLYPKYHRLRKKIRGRT